VGVRGESTEPRDALESGLAYLLFCVESRGLVGAEGGVVVGGSASVAVAGRSAWLFAFWDWDSGVGAVIGSDPVGLIRAVLLANFFEVRVVLLANFFEVHPSWPFARLLHWA